MPKTKGVAAHYAKQGLLERIEAGLERSGITPPLDPDDLSPVDEFHIGGRLATMPFLEKLGLTAASRVIDLGCGLGGPARAAAKQTGAHVTGIDLCTDFIETGRALTGLSVMLDRVDLLQGSVLDLPFESARFDAAYMIHVGMNIDDKPALAREAARVLKPNCVFGIFDVMQVAPGQVEFPVPWAGKPEQSALASPETYCDALRGAGFEIETKADRSEFANAFFARMRAARAAENEPPPLGLHLVMGSDADTKMNNLVAGIEAGVIAPVEIIARRTAGP